MGLTFLAARPGVHFTGQLRETRAWCSVCHVSDVEPYDRLLWALRIVDICPIHECSLTDKCRSCGRGHRPWHSRISTVSCQYCGAPLGDVMPRTVRRASADRARLAAGVIEFLQANNHIDRERIRGAVHHLRREVGESELAAITGMALSAIRAQGRIGFGNLLRLLSFSGGNLGGHLDTAQSMAAMRPSAAHDRLREAAEDALRVDLRFAPTLTEFANTQGVSTYTVGRHLPELATRLVARAREKALVERAARDAAVAESAWRAVDLLTARGALATLDNVMAAVGAGDFEQNRRVRSLFMAGRPRPVSG